MRGGTARPAGDDEKVPPLRLPLRQRCCEPGGPARLTESFEAAPAAAGQGAVGRQPGDDAGTDKPRAVPAAASHFPYPLFSCMGRPHL